MEKYIEFEHIGKTFPGQKALDDVSFSIRKGEPCNYRRKRRWKEYSAQYIAWSISGYDWRD